MAATTDELQQHYRGILSDRMRDLPFVNPKLEVETIGFRDFEGHQLGVLITPWFMNLVLLPGTDDWDDRPQGSTCRWSLPEGRYDFNICRDDVIGTYMTAVLFRSVADFPDQDTARAIAIEIMERLFEPADEAPDEGRRFTRRDLFRALGDD